MKNSKRRKTETTTRTEQTAKFQLVAKPHERTWKRIEVYAGERVEGARPARVIMHCYLGYVHLTGDGEMFPNARAPEHFMSEETYLKLLSSVLKTAEDRLKFLEDFQRQAHEVPAELTVELEFAVNRWRGRERTLEEHIAELRATGEEL